MADISTFSAPPLDRTISSHAGSADAMARRGFGPRVRRLHARIGAAHRQAEGMVFSRALLDGNVSPLQLAALIRALAPAYERIERLAPPLVEALGGSRWPWAELARSRALRFDVERLAVLPATPVSPAAQAWLQRLEELASTAPHRFLAHVYVRYGGDLSGGQQLAAQAAAILADHGLPPLGFWQFARPVAELKQRFHDSFEQLVLSAQQEQELLDECEAAFRATQGLLAELAEPAMPMPGDPALPTTVPVAPVPVASACVDDVLELLLRYDRPVPRYTSYPTAAAFAPGVTAADLVAELRRAASQPLSLYVHVPFCRHACWYCGCNRVTTQAGSKVVEPYLRSVARELALLEQAGAARRPLVQLHWGGGTPNYLNAGEQARLWALIERHFSLVAELEASIELNPEFLSREEVLGLRRLGFNRVSFGIQDADPAVQRAVNRVVPADQLRRVMGWLREADFASVNVDLICGLPLQTPERIETTLELVRELGPDRISLFSFAYLPEQLPLQRRIAADDLPSRRERLAMLQRAHHLLCAHGYDAIGMDHYARSDDGLAIAAREGRLHRNFQGYTTGGELDLLGVGPTAISQFPTLFSQNRRDLKAWAADLEQGRLPVERGLLVRDADVLERRALIQAVMCRFRVVFDRWRFAAEWREFGVLEADGLVRRSLEGDSAVVEVTASGRWLIRSIAAVFDPAQRLQANGSRLI